MIKKISYCIFITLAILSCNSNKTSGDEEGTIKGKLIIFHAGSLSMPFKVIADSFKVKYPNIDILAESAGSVDCARKITELNRDCDIIASADYTVIDNLLMPKFVSENVMFAANEMALVYTDKSKYASQINANNWCEIIKKQDVVVGRADPNSDPCGYRTVLCLLLAQKHYINQGFDAKDIFDKDKRYIRPKEVDLLALLDTRSVDYIFLYKSVAEQHKLKYLVLPDQINLKKKELNSLYGSVQTKIRGSKPGDTLTIKGEAMIYSAAILKNAPNKKAAEAFMKYLLSTEGGKKIMSSMGQTPVN